MSLLKNSSIVIFGIVISNLLAYVFHIYVGRVLGPVEYGVFGALMALFLIIALPASAIGSAITKFTAKFNSNKEYEKIGILRKILQNKIVIFGAIILLFIVMLSQNIADYLKIESNFSIMIVGFTLIFALILPINRGILQGMKKFKVYSGNVIIESLSRLILVILLFFLGLGVNGAVLAYGLAYLVAFIAIFPYIKEIKIENKENLEMKQIYKFIFLVLSVNLVIQLIINAPTLFIKHYFSSEFTGYWTAALNLARISLFITGGITLVMFPEVSGEKSYYNKRRIFGKAMILTLFVSIGIALMFWLFPGIFIQLLYGSSYLGAIPILQYMGIAMVFIGVLQLWLNYWMAGKD